MRAHEFVSEKWSEKYKRSINCANPRGFSQRAHCAGRRKNEDLNEFAPGGGEGNGPFDYGRAIVEIGEDFAQQYNDPGAEADARAIIRVGQTFMSGGMTAGIQAFYRLDTQVRDHVAEQLEDRGFNVRQDIYAKGPMAPAQRDTGAEDQQNILALLRAFVKTRTEPKDRQTVAEIYQAFQQGLAQGFTALYNAWEFDIDADFIDFAQNYGVDVNAIAEKHGQQLNELTFMGSPCTKDCSGHRAGYEWSLRKGRRHAASWSRSFNNGAAIAASGL